MDTILQLHSSCSISHKGLHQVQLFHRARLESSWVMKNKAWITPKNQFIFNVMVPSLNAVSMVHTTIQAFNLLPMNPVQSRGQSVNCHTSAIWRIACQEVLDLLAIGIEYLGKLCSIANTLQYRRFTCIRSANNEDPETTNTVEVLLDLRRIQTEILFDTRRDDFDLWKIYMMRIFSPCGDGVASYRPCLFNPRGSWGLFRIYTVIMCFFGP